MKNIILIIFLMVIALHLSIDCCIAIQLDKNSSRSLLSNFAPPEVTGLIGQEAAAKNLIAWNPAVLSSNSKRQPVIGNSSHSKQGNNNLKHSAQYQYNITIYHQELPAATFLHWTYSDPYTINRYNIYRKGPSQGEFVLWGTVAPPTTYYYDTSFSQPESNEYDYTVVACHLEDQNEVCNCDPNDVNGNDYCSDDSRAEKLKPHLQFLYLNQIATNFNVFTGKQSFGDVNGDGYIDALFLMSTESVKNGLALSINDNGHLTQPVLLRDMGDSGSEPLLRDLNGDGYLDIVYCYSDSNTSEWRILKGNGNGTFQDAISYPGECGFIRAADIDRDGDLDLITASSSGILLWLNNITIDQQEVTHWNFSSRLITAAAGNTYYFSFINIADVNNDSFDDIIVAGVYDDEENEYLYNEIFINDKDGKFKPEVSWESDDYINSMYVADFDNDGDVDIFTDLQSGFKYYQNNGSGIFEKHNAVIYFPSPPSATLILSPGDIGDLDNDGDIDLMASGNWRTNGWPPSMTTPEHYIFRGLGNGEFVYYDEAIANGLASGTALIDLDNDGDLDAVLAYNPEMDFGGEQNSLIQQPLRIIKPQQNIVIDIAENAEADTPDPNHPYGGNKNEAPDTPDLENHASVAFYPDYIEIQYDFNTPNPDTLTGNKDLYCNLYIGTGTGLDDIYQTELGPNHFSLSTQFPCGITPLRINRNILFKAGSAQQLHYSIQFVDQNGLRSNWSAEQTFSIAGPAPPTISAAANYENGNLVSIRVTWNHTTGKYKVYWGAPSRNYSKNYVVENAESYDILAANLEPAYCGVNIVYIAVTSINEGPPYRESIFSNEAIVSEDSYHIGLICHSISGYIGTNTEWGPNDCYHVTGIVTVNNGSTLTIREKTCVFFNDYQTLQTEDQPGTPNNIIIVGNQLTPAILKLVDKPTQPNQGLSIAFQSANSSSMQYAEIYDLYHMQLSSSQVVISGTKIESDFGIQPIDNLISSVSNSALHFENSSIKLTACLSTYKYILYNRNANNYLSNTRIETIRDCTSQDTSGAIQYTASDTIDGQPFSNLIVKKVNGTYVDDGIYLSSTDGTFSKNLYLFPFGWSACEHPLSSNCSIIPYYVSNNISIYSSTTPKLIANNARLIFKDWQLITIGNSATEKAGFQFINSSATGDININITQYAIPYNQQGNSGSMIIGSSFIKDSSPLNLKISTDMFVAGNIMKSPIDPSSPIVNFAYDGNSNPTVFLENNLIIDTSFSSSSDSYMLKVQNGALYWENNILYHQLTSDSPYAKGILWSKGKIISTQKNNQLYKCIGVPGNCIKQKDGIYLNFGGNKINEDFSFQKHGTTCINNNCSSYIPYYVLSSMSFGKPLDDLFITIEKGIEINLGAGISFEIGYNVGPPGEYYTNYYAGIKAEGTESEHIKIFLDNSNIQFNTRNQGYNELAQSGSFLKYVDFENVGSGNAYFSVLDKQPLLFENSTFKGLQYIQISYSQTADQTQPPFFLPQAIFKYCTFEQFKGYYGVFFLIGHGRASIEYSNFIDNQSYIIHVAVFPDSQLKMHHCNIYDSSTPIKIEPAVYQYTNIDVRWNFWEISVPDETTLVQVMPYYVNAFNKDNLHIDDSHIDSFIFRHNDSHQGYPVNVSMKPSAYSNTWKVRIECPELEAVEHDGVVTKNQQYGRISLTYEDLKCNPPASSCNCTINILMPKDNPQSNMQAIIQVNSNSGSNSFYDPEQSALVSDELSVTGISEGSYSLYYHEFPSKEKAELKATGTGSFNYDYDLSNYPRGEGYLILLSNDPITTRVRHIYVGYGRPKVKLSKQQINLIPSANDSVVITVQAPVPGNAEMTIQNEKDSSAKYAWSYTFTYPDEIQTIDWTGKDNDGNPLPAGAYRVKVTLAETAFPYRNFVYDPYSSAMASWRNFEVYSPPVDLSRIPFDDLGLLRMDYKAPAPSIANVYYQESPHSHPTPPFEDLYKDEALYCTPEGKTWTFLFSEKAKYAFPKFQSNEYNLLMTTRLPENLIVGYDDAPEIESVTAPSAVYRPTAGSAWSPGFLFTVYFKSQPQSTRGVMAKIRPCGTPPGSSSDRIIEKQPCGQVCIISWDAKNDSNDYLDEGCYQAEFYGIYTINYEGGSYKSYTSVPWRLYFDLFY